MTRKRTALHVLAEQLNPGDCPGGCFAYDDAWLSHRKCAESCDSDQTACWVEWAKWKVQK